MKIVIGREGAEIKEQERIQIVAKYAKLGYPPEDVDTVLSFYLRFIHASYMFTEISLDKLQTLLKLLTNETKLELE